MPLVLDSSALITLAGADALGLLRLSPHKACTVGEVYREAVEWGREKGRPDALLIGRLFERGIVTIQDPRRRERLPGISQTDSLVIHLAEEARAALCLMNDQELRDRAVRRGLPARYTAEFVNELYVTGNISQTRRDALLQAFLANRRYTEHFLQSLFSGGGPWKQ